MSLLEADLVLHGGRITTCASADGDGPEPTAVAVGRGRILAVGSDDDVRARASRAAQVVNLDGRRVIPGLNDGHVHFMRAGRTWNQEVRWEDVYNLADALDTIRAAAGSLPRGEWIRVIGGWDQNQFSERRGPTREELDNAAPDHPVYVQMSYTWAQLNTSALAAMGITEDTADGVERTVAAGAPGAYLERTGDGGLTGRGFGMPFMKWFYRQLPTPTLDQQVDSTIALSRDFARLGLTGAVDGGGVNTGPDAYQAIYEAWRRRGLRTRIRLFKHAEEAGSETRDFAGYLRFDFPHAGDEMLRTAGVGEVFLYKSHDTLGIPADDSPEALDELYQILRGFAARRWPIQIHAHNPEFIAGIIGVWEKVHAETPIDQLRWGIVHAEGTPADCIKRLRALGAGLYLQGLMRFSGETSIERWGAQRVAESPPMRALLDAGVPIALGSDAMRVASYNPFASMQWFHTGHTVSGTPTLHGENLLTREEALYGYTMGSAWATHEEHERGSLEPGKLADLAVLSDDLLAVPADRMHLLTSELTLVGGDIAWSSGAINVDDASRQRTTPRPERTTPHPEGA